MFVWGTTYEEANPEYRDNIHFFMNLMDNTDPIYGSICDEKKEGNFTTILFEYYNENINDYNISLYKVSDNTIANYKKEGIKFIIVSENS